MAYSSSCTSRYTMSMKYQTNEGAERNQEYEKAIANLRSCFLPFLIFCSQALAVADRSGPVLQHHLSPFLARSDEQRLCPHPLSISDVTVARRLCSGGVRPRPPPSHCAHVARHSQVPQHCFSALVRRRTLEGVGGGTSAVARSRADRGLDR